MVCRVFKKKSQKAEGLEYHAHTKVGGSSSGSAALMGAEIGEPKRHNHTQQPYNEYGLDGCMQLPQLFSPDSAVATPVSIECPQNMWRLNCGGVQQERLNTDWSFLSRLLASDHQSRTKSALPDQLSVGHPNSTMFPFPFPFPFPYPYHLPSAADSFKFSK